MKVVWLATVLSSVSAATNNSRQLQDAGSCPDTNADGLVGVDDLLALLAMYGQTCPGFSPPALDCAAQVDVQVATGFCEAQGGPQAVTAAFCVAETSDPDALLQACNVLGVADTGRVACLDLGYSDADCADVADQVAAAFSDCATLSVGAPALCPQLGQLATEADCQTWAVNNGQSLGLGSQVIAALEPHTAGGTNFNDFCVAAGGPQAATNAACVGVSAEQVTAVCQALGGPVPAVIMLCGELGFSAETCQDIAATGVPPEVNTCEILVAAQPALCQGIATANTDPDCDAWAPDGFIGGAPAAFNDALTAMSDAEMQLLAATCASVAGTDNACAGQTHGHICAHVDIGR